MSNRLSAEPRHTAAVAANILDAVADEFDAADVQWIPVATLHNIARQLRTPKEPAA